MFVVFLIGLIGVLFTGLYPQPILDFAATISASYGLGVF